jgi:hypothetical protein
MSPHFPVKASVSLPITYVRTRCDDVHQFLCMCCDGGLNLHQPDPRFPDRLLGVCTNCQRWHILDMIPDKHEAVIVSLPEAGHFLKIGGPLNGYGGR